jgi:hypothetical protein
LSTLDKVLLKGFYTNLKEELHNHDHQHQKQGDATCRNEAQPEQQQEASQMQSPEADSDFERVKNMFIKQTHINTHQDDSKEHHSHGKMTVQDAPGLTEQSL